MIEIGIDILNNDVQKNKFEQLISQATKLRQKVIETTSTTNLTTTNKLQDDIQKLVTNTNRVYDVITATFAYRQQSISKLSILQANWYYTWGLNPLKMKEESDDFVPMI